VVTVMSAVVNASAVTNASVTVMLVTVDADCAPA